MGCHLRILLKTALWRAEPGYQVSIYYLGRVISKPEWASEARGTESAEGTSDLSNTEGLLEEHFASGSGDFARQPFMIANMVSSRRKGKARAHINDASDVCVCGREILYCAGVAPRSCSSGIHLCEVTGIRIHSLLGDFAEKHIQCHQTVMEKAFVYVCGGLIENGPRGSYIWILVSQLVELFGKD